MPLEIFQHSLHTVEATSYANEKDLPGPATNNLHNAQTSGVLSLENEDDWPPWSDQLSTHLWLYSHHQVFMQHSCVAAALNTEAGVLMFSVH